MTWNINSISSHVTSFKPENDPTCKITEVVALQEGRQLSVTITTTAEHYPLLEEQFEFHSEFGSAQTHGVYMTNQGYHCSLTVDESTERDVMLRFLVDMIIFEPSIQDILPDIQKALNYQDKNTAYESLINQSDKENANFVLILLSARKLYKQGFRDVFHVLAEHFFETGRDKEGVHTLHLIPVDDSLGHFRAAEIYRRMAEHAG